MYDFKFCNDSSNNYHREKRIQVFDGKSDIFSSAFFTMLVVLQLHDKYFIAVSSKYT